MGIIKNIILRNRRYVTYDGELKAEKPEGKGKALYRDGGWYDGHWHNGKQHGYGREYYTDEKLRYEGQFMNGYRHGEGTSYYTNGIIAYKGLWKYGRPRK